MIRLFEIENNTVKETEHCHIIKWLKVLKEEYPDNYLTIYAYIFYMTCPSEENPFFNLPENIREDNVERSIDIDFDTEDDLIQTALKEAAEMYQTPTVRSYKSICKMLDNLNDYLANTTITDGRDGNINSLLRVAKEFDAIRKSFKGVAQDLESEQAVNVRGGQSLSYDQL